MSILDHAVHNPFRTLALSVAGVLAGVVATETSAQERATTGLDEIVVTAQRRAERLQDIPISVAAFDDRALEARGVTNLRQITTFTPNVELTVTNRPTAGGSAYAAWIRGVGTGDYAYPTDPGIGLYLDGVYLARTLGGLMSVSDLERVEVLRGPQGTLYGRNTIGGAINVITTTPRLSGGAAGMVGVRYGEDKRLDVQGHVNAPLLESRIGGKLAFGVFRSDGYGRRLFDGTSTNDEDRAFVRGGLLFRLSEVAELDVRADYSRQRNTGVLSNAAAYAAVTPALIGRFNAIAAPVQATALGLPGGAVYDSRWVVANPYVTWSDSPLQDNYDIGGVSATLSMPVSSAFSFKSISAWRDLRTEIRVDGDTSPFTISSTHERISDEQLSQEFQVSGALLEGRLRYLAGAYYFRETGEGERTSESFHGVYEVTGLASDARDTLVVQDYKAISKALFTQEEFDLTPRVTAVVGARVNWDDKTFTTETRLPQRDYFVSIPRQTRSEGWSSFTPRVGLNWKPYEGGLLYVTYSEGFKSGGFGNPTATLPAPVYGPEKLGSIEVGAKTEWWNGRAVVNVAAFRSEWRDIQLNVIVPGPTGGVVNVTQNGGDARLMGAELEATVRATEGLKLNVGAGYTGHKFTRLAGGVVGLTLSSKLPHVPKWTATVGAQYDLQAMLGAWSFRVDAGYRGQQYLTIADPTSHEPAHTIVNARIGLKPSALPRLEFALEASNLTDEDYLIYNQNASIFGVQLHVPGEPRRISATARYRF
jgi:iron complex outermembrane receptor protein